VDKLLIRPATERPGMAPWRCRTYQVKDTRVRVGPGHDTAAEFGLVPFLGSVGLLPAWGREVPLTERM